MASLSHPYCFQGLNPVVVTFRKGHQQRLAKNIFDQHALLFCPNRLHHGFILHGRLLPKFMRQNSAFTAAGSSSVGVAKRFNARSENATAQEVTRADTKGTPTQELATVVIVGGGIAGLSTALALRSVGVRSVVLEQSPSVRASGTTLTIWRNAWRALDVLGVGDLLRQDYAMVNSLVFADAGEQVLKSFNLTECPGGPHEVRAVERKALLQGLYDKLPPGTVRFNSRVKLIKKAERSGVTDVELEDGTVISGKVLIGCDGVNSVVGKYLGLATPRYVGQYAIRGMGVYPPEGHNLGDKIRVYVGEGKRVGIFPMSPTKAYWFVVANRPSQGKKVTDLNLIKQEAFNLTEGLPSIMTELIEKTPLENFTRSFLRDRWNIPGMIPPLVRDGVTVAGDAFHPMTPNVGQGGCTAIEDAIVFAQKISQALVPTNDGKKDLDGELLKVALEEYVEKRQARTLPLVLRSYVIGQLLMLDIKLVTIIRNKLVLPKLVGPETFLSHTLFDVGSLPTPSGL